jgi:hypothetical protein
MIKAAIKAHIPDRDAATRRAIKQTEQRLYAFPDICLRAQTAEGIDALILDHEIRDIKGALSLIADKPYYQIIPACYFKSYTGRDAAALANCDLKTVQRNKKRLLETMAVYLYGPIYAPASWEM